LTLRPLLTKAEIRDLLLATNVSRAKGKHRLCPRCGKVGILTRKWGSRVYYPQYSSVYVDLPYMLEHGYVTGEKYRITRDPEKYDKNICYKVRYPQRYEQWCIAHYEPGGHRKQCYLKRGRDYHYTIGDLPKLKRSTNRHYSKKKDMRYRDRLSQKIAELKNNGICIVRERASKKPYRLYLF
jgi:hypothetical protein